MLLTMYTDGGCSGNRRGAGCPGSWAYIILDIANNILDKNCGIEHDTTNNRMELHSIINGLENIKKMIEYNLYSIIIKSDSKYVINNYEEFLPEWKKSGWRKCGGGLVINSDLWKRLDLLIPDFKSVSFQWVKGHAGDEFNALADQMVRSKLYPTEKGRSHASN